jgi:transmembrane protein 222
MPNKCQLTGHDEDEVRMKANQAVEIRVDSSTLQLQTSSSSSSTKSYSDRGTVPRKSSVLLGKHPTSSLSSSTSTEEMSALHIVEPSSDRSEYDSSGTKDHDDLSFTIVWSPLPPITWLIPFIGHTGICDSNGIASDFQGPYYVGDDGRMAFGAPTRALKISGVAAEPWDAAIQTANEVYRGRMHNICCDNCHSHAYGITKWNMVKIATLVFFRGRFLSWSAILQQFLPLTLLVVIWLAVWRPSS